MSSAVLYESHCHTPLCKHAIGEPEEYAARAALRGLKGVIFTCHCPLPDGFSADLRMAPEQYETYVDLVARAQAAWEGKMDIRLGLESDYYPGVESWLEKLHARAPLHHVLGSVHYQLSPYRQQYYNGDVFLYQQVYYDHLARAAESGLFDTLSHPDLIKNENPEEWIFSRIRPHVERALDRIAAAGVAMELNTSGLNKAYPEMNPGREQLELMFIRHIPVVIGSDAHRPERVGDQFGKALILLREVGYREVSFFLERQRQTVPIETALASLRDDLSS